MAQETAWEMAREMAWEMAREMALGIAWGIAWGMALFGVDLTPTISKANFQNIQVIYI